MLARDRGLNGAGLAHSQPEQPFRNSLVAVHSPNAVVHVTAFARRGAFSTTATMFHNGGVFINKHLAHCGRWMRRAESNYDGKNGCNPDCFSHLSVPCLNATKLQLICGDFFLRSRQQDDCPLSFLVWEPRPRTVSPWSLPMVS